MLVKSAYTKGEVSDLSTPCVVWDLVIGWSVKLAPCVCAGKETDEPVTKVGTLPETVGTVEEHLSEISLLVVCPCEWSQLQFVHDVFLLLEDTCDETEDKLEKE